MYLGESGKQENCKQYRTAQVSAVEIEFVLVFFLEEEGGEEEMRN